MKTILCLALLGLIASVAYTAVTPSAASFTAGSFNSTPVKVFDYANATTGTPDASITATGVNSVTFGAGTTNTTIYVWAVKIASNVISGVIKRTLNATQVALGTDTAENSVQVADATITLSATVANTPVMATAPGYFAIAGVVVGNTKQSGTADVLNLYVIAGSGTSATTVLVDTAAATTATNYFTFAANSMWSEDGVFYILYETQKEVGTGSTTAAFASQTSNVVTALNLQGYNTTASKLMYTATVSVAGTLAITQTISAFSYTPITNAMGAGNNYSMSTSIQILYKDPTSGSAKLYYVAVAKTAGTAGSVSTVGTDVTQSSTVAGAVYTAGGFFGSNYTYGFVISNATQAAAAVAGATTYGLMADLNGSTTAGSASYSATQNQLAIATGSNGALTVRGFPYGTGFAAIIVTPQSSGGPAYSWQTYFANGTVNATAATAIGSAVATVSTFMDVNGAIWLGYYSTDVQGTPTQGPTTGYIGRLVSQVNYYNATTTKAANVLATFAAILTFVVASLFMF